MKGGVAGSISLLVVVSFLLVIAPPTASGGPTCEGMLPPNEPQAKPGPRLRFGITPAGRAGVIGPEGETKPGDPRKTLAALHKLKPRHAPLVIRLNRLFWSLRYRGIRRFLRAARRYARAGFKVELQLRYHPDEKQEGRIGAFTRWVRRVVRRFGRIRRVVAMQVTNEVNFTYSPDSSDGSYDRAKDALIRGVVAAKSEARKRGFKRLEIGFNWFYRTDQANENSFWEYIADHSGRRFLRSLDWVGLDAYPGTYFPPQTTPGGERGALINALSVLRKCYLPIPGIPRSVPLRVEENGYPTGDGRSYERQKESMRTMIKTIHEFRGTYHVTDYRWFDLRDMNTDSSNFQEQYGILKDNYKRKPAFRLYRRLVGRLSR